MENKIICYICNNFITNSMLGLLSHVAQKHKLSSKEYYDRYLKRDGEGICPVCGKETKFQNISKGYLKHCSCKCSANDLSTRQKYIDTCLENLGTTNYFNSNEWKEKSSKIENNRTPKDKEKIRLNREETCLKKYGVKNTYQSNELMNKVDRSLVYKKVFDTKSKNNTFNTSKPEDEFYEELKILFDEVKRNYKCEKYPYLCDFYIPILDLYIELNLHWTHGKHWFDENNSDDIEVLNKWKERSETSKYYKIAINVWTRNDLKKRAMAIDNKLNYVVLWNKKDIDKFLRMYKNYEN